MSVVCEVICAEVNQKNKRFNSGTELMSSPRDFKSDSSVKASEVTPVFMCVPSSRNPCSNPTR